MRKRVSVGFAVLIVLAAVAPAAAAGEPSAAVDADGNVAQQRADPDTDTVGWESGYWHDDAISVDQSDGLSDAEMDAYVGRAMARVEYLRQTEFQSDVPVEIISRSEFTRNGNSSSNASFVAWNNQVWEALFVVGEEANVQSKLQSAVGSSTAGFYAPSDDRIRIITETPESPTIDNTTLIHELTHALQDQNGNLGERLSSSRTQDGDLAVDGVVEGEANYIEKRYVRRCGSEWDCVAKASSSGSGSSDPPNLGILLTLLQPYSDGPVYIDWLLEQGGWSAVDAAFADPPTSSEQIIHRTDERPTPIEFEDRARNGWKLYPEQGENGSDTVGEASMYVMFWYQARTAGADTVPVRSLLRTTNPFDMYDYSAEPSAGWGNDRVFPYHKGSGDDAKHGYVWVTEWDSEQDAAQFVEAYRAILDAHDATRTNGTYVIPDGEFADAFRIDRDGTRVTIVNGPTPEAVSQIRPPGAATDTGGDGNAAGTTAAAGGDGGSGSTGLGAPGFGPLTAVIAVIAAFGVLARRRD
ncbi:MAG: Hvo_1808 family surface protein [Haloplanus sp.]